MLRLKLNHVDKRGPWGPILTRQILVGWRMHLTALMMTVIQLQCKNGCQPHQFEHFKQSLLLPMKHPLLRISS